MMPFVWQTRMNSYLTILEWGLISIRGSAYDHNTALCEVESDHIHNLPSLINEPNQARHHYYIDSEKPLYLERVRKIASQSYIESALAHYSEPWEVLETLAKSEKSR